MDTANNHDELTRLRAQLREAEQRLQQREREWEVIDRQRRMTERLFTAAFDESPEAIGISRLSDGLLVDVNQEWLNLTGYAREEVIGHTVLEIGHWADKAARDDALESLRTTGRLRNSEAVVNFKDKSERRVLLNGSVIDAGGEKHILMTMKDITSERMAEEALERANEQLSTQLELYELTETLANVGYWAVPQDGQEVTVSRGRQRLSDNSLGPTVRISESRRCIHPDDLQAFLDARHKMDGEVLEYRWLLPDGSTRWLRTRMHRHQNARGDVTDFGVVMDVTAEHEAALALRQKLDFIENITSQIPDVLFQYQSRADGGGAFPFISASVKTMFKVTPEEAQRDVRAVFGIVHPDDREGVFASMREAYRDDGVWRHEYRLRLRDGTVVWVLGNAITRRDARGELISYGSISDITERKLAEQRLQESEARFRSLTDLSSDWYWEIDEHFRFTRFDGYREGKSVITKKESLGKTRWELGALNLSEDDWDAHQRVLESHQPFRDLELQRVDAEDKIYWISISGTPFFDAKGVFRGYRGIGRDISTRK
ncbi:MAG: PAS domain S-box protein, partial [Gammaproteobacteria bacterium]|nr:PAS domain S-box protein [Gammaproteobacteria bacterium]